MEVSFPNGAAAPWVWVLAFALSLVCCSAAAFEILFSNESRSRWIRRCLGWGLLSLALLAMADFCSWNTGLSPAWQLSMRTGVIGLGFAVVAMILRTNGSGKRTATGLALLSSLAISWTFVRVMELDQVTPTLESSDIQSTHDQVEKLTLYANTDGGRAVPLFHCPEPEGTSNGAGQTDTTVSPELLAHVIAAAPPSNQSNCHGWVFTGGRFIVRGATVDSILIDNDYREVDVPDVGDLIVYRDSEGVPRHTGVVKATGEDGFVLIESKWGFDGLFWHEPQNQSYSQEFAYYRSPRSGHLLKLDESESVARRPARRNGFVL